MSFTMLPKRNACYAMENEELRQKDQKPKQIEDRPAPITNNGLEIIMINPMRRYALLWYGSQRYDKAR